MLRNPFESYYPWQGVLSALRDALIAEASENNIWPNLEMLHNIYDVDVSALKSVLSACWVTAKVQRPSAKQVRMFSLYRVST